MVLIDNIVVNWKMFKRSFFVLACVHCVTSANVTIFAAMDNERYHVTCNVTSEEMPDILSCARLCRGKPWCNAIEMKATDSGNVTCFILASEYSTSGEKGTTAYNVVRIRV